MNLTFHEGDCREVLRRLIDEGVRVHSVVTDPPYALTSTVKRFGAENAAPAKGGVYARSSAGFMGQKWDTGEVAFDPKFWALVAEILLPGGHVVSFGGARTYHRLACAIEDGGFEIRDQLAWVYGSGFPKSHDVSKGIDKAAGAAREVIGKSRRHAGATSRDGSVPDLARFASSGDSVTAPATPEAAAWEGWGTALKPAREPICLARKPLIGTVAANVLAHGTGALNIDGCRIHADDAQGGKYTVKRRKPGATLNKSGGNWRPEEGVEFHGEMKPGRWPANLIHDGSAEVVALFPQSDGQAGTVRGTEPSAPTKDIYGRFGGRVRSEARGDTGSAARFFNAFPPEGEPLRYCPKAAKADRAGSRHPTVKPIALMRWLCRLVTPPGGTILDPFAGSGTTGVAALAEGFAPILIERDANYAADLRRRFDLAANDADEIAQMLGFETDVASMLG